MSNRIKQSRFSSTTGVILAMAGVAIGLGNIWRFPYMMGEYGGSVFLLTYLIIAFAFGIPGLMTEWALGRHTGRGPWGAFEASGMPGGRLWSTVILITVTMAASYYVVVIGWVLQEAQMFLAAATTGRAVKPFSELTESVFTQVGFLSFTIVIGCTIIGFGIRKGIERASRVLVPLFFFLFLVLAVRVLMLDGAGAGLQSFLKPQWDNFSGRTALAAMGQAIFSLGLGGMFMVRYGSYMSAGEDIPRGAVFTTVADVGAALLAGLIVVPAVLAFGLDLEGGPSLMFQVMPRVFESMPGGLWFGTMFFFSVFIVAVLSLIAAYEIIVSTLAETVGWSRSRSLALVLISQIALALPCYLVSGYIASSDLIWGSTMQPFGAALAVIALTWSVGKGKALEEIRRQSRSSVPDWLFWWIKFVLPGAIGAILVFGWIDWFSNR